MPSNFYPGQINQESGNRQFERDGKTPLRSSAGATGVAQVMPSTGPEAAKLAGLPWDPKRFENDRDYNFALGNAYQGMLDKKFGRGSVAALAAYNAGPGRVEGLQKRHGANWLAHAPAETRDYVKRIKGVSVASAAPKSFVDDIQEGLGIAYTPPAEPSDNQRASIEGRSQFGIATVADLDQPKIAAGAQEVVKGSEGIAAFLKGAMQPLIENSQRVVAETEAISATKNNLATDLDARSNALLERIRPYQEKRQAIADRIEEVRAMSPLERKLKSTFNSDYDIRVLEGRLAAADSRIELHAKEFSEVQKIKVGVAAAMIDADASDIDVANANSNHLTNTAKVMGTVNQAVRESIDIQMYPLQQQNAVTAAQVSQKAVLLSNMGTELVVDYARQAEMSPTGTIDIDGSTFTAGELSRQAQAAQGQDLSFLSMQNAALARDDNVRDQHESQFIDHMSPEQIDEALKNGGMYKGQQLSLSKLAAAGATSLAMRQQQVGATIQETTVGSAAETFRNFGASVKQTRQRTTEMFGTIPEELRQFDAMINVEMKKFETGRIEAESRGVRDEYVAAYMPRIAEMQKEFDGRITTLAKRWGGNKPELQAVAESWIRGAPISGDVAVGGAITMARSGLPAGVKLEGPAAAAFAAVRALVNDYDQPNNPNATGNAMEAMFSPQKKSPEDLRRRVQQTISSVYGANLTDELIRGLPKMAAGVRDESSPNKVHPFARVPTAEFSQAVTYGDNEGYEMIAAKIGISPVQAVKMFREGPESKIWQAAMVKGKFQPAQFNDFLAETNAAQMAATLQALDAGPSARDGFKPAQAFVSFMQSKAVATKVDQLAGAYGQAGFGSHIMSSSAGGGYRDGWSAYANGLATTYQQLNSATLKQSIQQQRGVFSDPYKRMNVVLGAAGLTKDERIVLSKGVRDVAGAPERAHNPMTGMLAPMAAFADKGASFDKLSYVIQNHKFEDPQMERVRKKAAARWDDMNSVVGLINESME